MKRCAEAEEHPCRPTLPIDLLVEVARCDDWFVSGALARTCKAALRLFTQRVVLISVVEACLARRMLLRWLLLSVPSDLLAEKLPVPTGIEAVARFRNMTFAAFVTGGAVSQCLYAREWDGDLDVWVQSPEARRALRYDGGTLDVVVRSAGDLERCIENFDMSVVQQGFFAGTAIPAAFCTPLALYSWQARVLIALPSRECIDYVGFLPSDREQRPCQIEVDIWHYIAQHESDYMVCGRHHDGTYHDCALCSDEVISSRGHRPFQRWRARMRSYVQRFPEFRVVYCHAPGEPVPRGLLSVEYDEDAVL